MLEAEGQPEGPGQEELGPRSVWKSLTSSETLQICSSELPHVLDCGEAHVRGPGPCAPSSLCCRVQLLLSTGSWSKSMGNGLFPAFPSELLVWLVCSKVWESSDQDSLEDNVILHMPLSGLSVPNLSGMEPQVGGQGRVSFTH